MTRKDKIDHGCATVMACIYNYVMTKSAIDSTAHAVGKKVVTISSSEAYEQFPGLIKKLREEGIDWLVKKNVQNS